MSVTARAFQRLRAALNDNAVAKEVRDLLNAIGATIPEGTTVGQLLDWSGTAWQTIAAGTAIGQSLVWNGTRFAAASSPDNLARIFQVSEDVAIGEPCYVTGWDGVNSRPIVSRATGATGSFPYGGQYDRELWFAAEAITGGNTGRFLPETEVVFDTTGATIGDPVFLGSGSFGAPLWRLDANDGYNEASRVIGEVVVVGVSGRARVWGNNTSDAFRWISGQTGHMSFTGIVSGGGFTATRKMRLVDAVMYAIGTDTGDWSVTVGGNTVFAMNTLSVNAGDVVRPDNFDWNNALVNPGDAIASVGANGLTAGRIHLLFVPER